MEKNNEQVVQLWNLMREEISSAQYYVIMLFLLSHKTSGQLHEIHAKHWNNKSYNSKPQKTLGSGLAKMLIYLKEQRDSQKEDEGKKTSK